MKKCIYIVFGKKSNMYIMHNMKVICNMNPSLVPLKYCFKLYKQITEGSRLCLGDSGSGLISYDENQGKLILHGIYILTTGLCGGRDEASFFTDVRYDFNILCN